MQAYYVFLPRDRTTRHPFLLSAILSLAPYFTLASCLVLHRPPPHWYHVCVFAMATLPASPPGGMKKGHRVHFARGRSSCAPRPIHSATCAARRNPRPAPASLGLLRTLAHSQRLWHSGAYSSSSCVTWPLLVSLQTFGEAFARSARACCRRSHTSQHRQP